MSWATERGAQRAAIAAKVEDPDERVPGAKERAKMRRGTTTSGGSIREQLIAAGVLRPVELEREREPEEIYLGDHTALVELGDRLRAAREAEAVPVLRVRAKE